MRRCGQRPRLGRMSPPARAHGGRRTRPHSPAPLRAVPGTSPQRKDASRGLFQAATHDGKTECTSNQRHEIRSCPRANLRLPNQSEHAELTEFGAVHARLYHVVAPVDFKRHSRRAESAWTCRIHSQKKAAPAQPQLRQSRVIRGQFTRRQRPRRLSQIRTLGLPSRPPRHGTARPQHRSSSRLCARPVSTTCISAES